MRLFFLLLIFSLTLDSAHAYIGPGLGLGVIGAAIGLVAAVFLAIVGTIWYPLKRMLGRLKSRKTEKRKENV